MAPMRVILTYKDYEALPQDGRCYEIHEGELVVSAAPAPRHQVVTANLFRVLDGHVEPRRLGKVLFAPIDVIFSDITIIQPDLLFLEASRLGSITSRGIEGPPTLVVQVLSPSTAPLDRSTRMQLCARHVVPHYWLVDPDARVLEAYVLGEGGYDLHLRATGSDPVFLPPFTDLPIIPESLWP